MFFFVVVVFSQRLPLRYAAQFVQLATTDAHSPSVPQLICLLQVGGGGGAESRLLILIMLFRLKGRNGGRDQGRGRKQA